MPESNTLRREFESWAVKYKGSHNLPLFTFFKDIHGQYICMDCQVAWEAWQASRKAICIDLPRCWNEEQDEYSSAVINELESAGVRYK